MVAHQSVSSAMPLDCPESSHAKPALFEEKIEKVEQKFEAQNAAQVTQFNTVIASIEKFLQNFRNDLGFGSSRVLRNKSFLNFYYRYFKTNI